MDTCKLVGKIANGAGEYVAGTYIHAICYDSPAILQDTSTGIIPSIITVLSTSTGEFELTLARNVNFTIHIPEMGFRKTIRVPNLEGPVILWSLTDVFISGDPTPENEDSW